MKILFRHQGGKWERINHMRYSGEAHLQDILYQDPDVIPIEDVVSDTELSPIRLMLKEIGLPGSGSTDLVGVDKNGNIFIIETKLATNPEAKREVIGQILEYAAFLHGRELDWFKDVVQEKTGASITQHFEKEPEWDEESFLQNLQDNLQNGDFKLFIVVDEMNPDLQQTINYMNNVLDIDIYALELRYFKEKSGIEILVPNVHGGKKQVVSKTRKQWTEESFFEDAKKKVDSKTLQTMREIYDFSREIGEVSFGTGYSSATFHCEIRRNDESVKIYFISSQGRGKDNYLCLEKLQQIDPEAAKEYVRQLNSLGLGIDETKKYPTFDLSILNDEDKLSRFKKYTMELKESIIRKA